MLQAPSRFEEKWLGQLCQWEGPRITAACLHLVCLVAKTLPLSADRVIRETLQLFQLQPEDLPLAQELVEFAHDGKQMPDEDLERAAQLYQRLVSLQPRFTADDFPLRVPDIGSSASCLSQAQLAWVLDPERWKQHGPFLSQLMAATSAVLFPRGISGVARLELESTLLPWPAAMMTPEGKHTSSMRMVWDNFVVPQITRFCQGHPRVVPTNPATCLLELLLLTLASWPQVLVELVWQYAWDDPVATEAHLWLLQDQVLPKLTIQCRRGAANDDNTVLMLDRAIALRFPHDLRREPSLVSQQRTGPPVWSYTTFRYRQRHDRNLLSGPELYVYWTEVEQDGIRVTVASRAPNGGIGETIVGAVVFPDWPLAPFDGFYLHVSLRSMVLMSHTTGNIWFCRWEENWSTLTQHRTWQLVEVSDQWRERVKQTQAVGSNRQRSYAVRGVFRPQTDELFILLLHSHQPLLSVCRVSYPQPTQDDTKQVSDQACVVSFSDQKPLPDVPPSEDSEDDDESESSSDSDYPYLDHRAKKRRKLQHSSWLEDDS